MFKRPARDLTPNQSANRTVNKVITYSILAFLLYATLYHSKKPELQHFNFTKPNATPVKLPPLVKVKNLDNGEVTIHLTNDNGLTLNGNNVIKVIP